MVLEALWFAFCLQAVRRSRVFQKMRVWETGNPFAKPPGLEASALRAYRGSVVRAVALPTSVSSPALGIKSDAQGHNSYSCDRHAA